MEIAEQDVSRYADMLAAMGAEARLRIMRLLLTAHPAGLVAGDIGMKLEIPASTLSHRLERLKHEDLVQARRQRDVSLAHGKHGGPAGSAHVSIRGVLRRKPPLRTEEIMQIKRR